MILKNFIKKALLTSAILVPFTSVEASNTVFTMGSYNIRVISTSDKGDYAWENRKEAVIKTIKDYDFDVIGLNEVVNGTQFNNLRDLLGADYSYVNWGNTSSVVASQGVMEVVVFKNTKFELLDNGHYFLSANGKAITSWDTNQVRLTVWAKLKAKETGEIFYFFCTHLDHIGTQARNEGARMNLRQMREIAGNYPAFIVGDHNSSKVRVSFYNLMNAYMDDCRFASAEPFSLKYDGTLCKWDPTNLDTSRLDYIWSKGANILTYEHILDTFGRQYTPSDHLALRVTCTLNDYVANRSRYVDVNASTNGDGTKKSPFNNIQDAISSVEKGDTICVTNGEYVVKETPGRIGREATLNVDRTITLIGGYDNDFKEVVGRTIISGDISGNDTVENGVIIGNEENVYNVITVGSSSALELRNCEVIGGNANSGQYSMGAGIKCSGAKVDLENVVIRDNVSIGDGAGIYAAGQLWCENAKFIRNVSGGKGGAFLTLEPKWWRYTLNNCYFSNNKATLGSAGYFTGISYAYIGNSTFVDNISDNYGTIAVMLGDKSKNDESYVSTVNFINNTFANNQILSTSSLINKVKGGSAIYVSLYKTDKVNMMNNTIIGNYASCLDMNGNPAANFNGAAVQLLGGASTLANNIIAGNRTTSTTVGGDVYYSADAILSMRNLYSCKESVNFSTNTTDIVGSSLESTESALVSMYDGEMVEGRFVANLSNNGGYVPTVKMQSAKFGTRPVNMLQANQLDGTNTGADVNNLLEAKTALTVDQRGAERRTDGTSCIGAYEYGTEGSVDRIADAESRINVWCESNMLYIKSEESSEMVADVYGIYGTKEATILVAGNCANTYDMGELPTGVYIVTIHGRKAFKFVKK